MTRKQINHLGLSDGTPQVVTAWPGNHTIKRRNVHQRFFGVYVFRQGQRIRRHLVRQLSVDDLRSSAHFSELLYIIPDAVQFGGKSNIGHTAARKADDTALDSPIHRRDNARSYTAQTQTQTTEPVGIDFFSFDEVINDLSGVQHGLSETILQLFGAGNFVQVNVAVVDHSTIEAVGRKSAGKTPGTKIGVIRDRPDQYRREFALFPLHVEIDLDVLGVEYVARRRKFHLLDNVAFLFGNNLNGCFDLLLGIAVVREQLGVSSLRAGVGGIARVMCTRAEQRRTEDQYEPGSLL